MSELLCRLPYSSRADDQLLSELVALTQHHIKGCKEYKSVWPEWTNSTTINDLPYLHVGVFKRVELKTISDGIQHERTLKSSSTTGASYSKIILDSKSSQLQSISSRALLENFIGSGKRKLLVIDSPRSLRQNAEVSARIAAALSLKSFATDILFILEESDSGREIKWDLVECAIKDTDEILVYGFTWILWLMMQPDSVPKYIKDKLKRNKITFVHSGGWKKLEQDKVSRSVFVDTLVQLGAEGSIVVDFYGLVEQVGVPYPECKYGFRHVPVWADIIVRDPFTLEPLHNKTGLIQLINALAWGAPYHSVLTEDLGIILPGDCECGRSGKKFKLEGRVPKAEVRGCANV